MILTNLNVQCVEVKAQMPRRILMRSVKKEEMWVRKSRL